MKNKSHNLRFYCTVVFSGILILFVFAFLFFLFHSENIQVQKKRSEETFVRIEGCTRQVMPDESAPAGVLTEYQFQISDDLNRDTSLAFYTVHQYIQVYIDGELIYSLYPSKEISMIRTPGSNWSVIPLYREDAGKKVCVILTPVYKNVEEREVEFLVGSYQAIYIARLKKDLPVLFIGGLFILLGLVMIILGFYSLHKYRFGWWAVSFGIFTEGIGLWRFFDTRFSPFINLNKPVLLFYIALISLMFMVIPFMLSMKNRIKSRNIEYYCIVVSVVGIVQLVLQVLGIVDLRQTLVVSHGLIILCFLMTGSSLVKKGKMYSRNQKRIRTVILVCMILGGAADLLFYYVRNTSSGLVYTMIGLLVYILYMGIGFIDAYISREKELMEKEQQIMQTRASAMMNQIKSHMVFNILNAISGMCKYDPEKADRTVVCFARYLRANINLMENDQPIPFFRILKNLEDYIALQQVRFGDKIRFVKDIKEDSFIMPVMILQPLVENAIQHGIKVKPEGGTITLRTWAEGNMIYITIHDDGVGFDMNQSPGKDSVGLRNVRTRLEYIMQGQLNIESIPGQGTTVTVCFIRKEVQGCM